MEGNRVKFRYGTPVTPISPVLIPGSFVFDSDALALYVDTDTGRVQVTDPLKLALTGGTLRGSLEVVSSDGATMCSLSAVTGVVRGQFIETTGNIALSETPGLIAVIDSDGRIRSRTLAEIQSDLGIIDPATLGALAYKDAASGSYTPEGSVSAPDVTVTCSTENVVKSITAGDLPRYEVSGEILSLSTGTQTTASNTDVVKAITAVDVSAPEFTGVTATITVS